MLFFYLFVYFTETVLPCEFCEELFPEEDLILHQVRKEIFFLFETVLLSVFTSVKCVCFASHCMGHNSFWKGTCLSSVVRTSFS